MEKLTKVVLSLVVLLAFHAAYPEAREIKHKKHVVDHYDKVYLPQNFPGFTGAGDHFGIPGISNPGSTGGSGGLSHGGIGQPLLGHLPPLFGHIPSLPGVGLPSGGLPTTGGHPIGGFPATGGHLFGGLPGAGGLPATGGHPFGGLPGTGGLPETGGLPSTGGLPATGGIPGGLTSPGSLYPTPTQGIEHQP